MHLALIGHGAIGRTLLSRLDEDPVGKLTLLVRPGRVAQAEEELEAGAAGVCRVTEDVDELAAARPDMVVEAAGQGAVAAYAPALLEAGLTVVIASVGSLADADLHRRLITAAAANGGRLVVPSGAIGGIDLLAAIAHAGDLRVRYSGTKPPGAWRGTPAEEAIDLSTLDRAVTFFEGNARDAARAYPKNANVAATLALAGAGFEATDVSLVADPQASGNRHSYSVESSLARFSVNIEGAASQGNAKTSITTVFSLLREVNRARRPMAI